MGLGWVHWLGGVLLGGVLGRILRLHLGGLADPFSLMDRVFTEEQEGDNPAVQVPIELRRRGWEKEEEVDEEHWGGEWGPTFGEFTSFLHEAPSLSPHFFHTSVRPSVHREALTRPPGTLS